MTEDGRTAPDSIQFRDDEELQNDHLRNPPQRPPIRDGTCPHATFRASRLGSTQSHPRCDALQRNGLRPTYDDPLGLRGDRGRCVRRHLLLHVQIPEIQRGCRRPLARKHSGRVPVDRGARHYSGRHGHPRHQGTGDDGRRQQVGHDHQGHRLPMALAL